MVIETTLWDPADRLTSREAILAYVEAALEDGDPDVIAAALEDVARAGGLNAPSLPPEARLAAVLRALSDWGVGLAVKAA
jgi:probable addiction module antidote protein